MKSTGTTVWELDADASPVRGSHGFAPLGRVTLSVATADPDVLRMIEQAADRWSIRLDRVYGTARDLARDAIDVLTAGDLGPSTVDLLTLEGCATVGGWLDDAELAAHVDRVLAGYENEAERDGDPDMADAIRELRARVAPLYAESAWGPVP